MNHSAVGWGARPERLRVVEQLPPQVPGPGQSLYMDVRSSIQFPEEVTGWGVPACWV